MDGRAVSLSPARKTGVNGLVTNRAFGQRGHLCGFHGAVGASRDGGHRGPFPSILPSRPNRLPLARFSSDILHSISVDDLGAQYLGVTLYGAGDIRLILHFSAEFFKTPRAAFGLGGTAHGMLQEGTLQMPVNGAFAYQMTSYRRLIQLYSRFRYRKYLDDSTIRLRFRASIRRDADSGP